MKTRLLFLSALLFFTLNSVTAQSALRVNPERLNGSIKKLSTYGKNTAGGSDRVAFSSHDLAAREYIMDLMNKAGLEVSTDFAGNIIGKKE